MMKFFFRSEVYVILALILVAITPLILQEGEPFDPDSADARLVIMTPHDETIRREFGDAFSAYWKEKTGQTLYMDWRTPGGTSEIRLILDGDFSRAEERGESGIGVDILFGGGDYIFKKMAADGRLQKLDVFENQKQWFEGEHAIKKKFTGEDCYSEDHLWVGVCLSSFGICYNVDGLKRLGIEAPESWDDLGDPRYFGHIALADPTKSGSVAKAFEMLIQQKIHEEIKVVVRNPGESVKDMVDRAKSAGWTRGLQLIQEISANARYFTDSASKIPHDVAQGDAVAGMCVDFYGRAYNEKLKKADRSCRMQWVKPKRGTSTSVDPVAVLRGADHPQIAQAFVEFLLSDKGQLLWNNKPGTPNGPKLHSLRRLPIRPDLYSPENLQHFTDPEILPYKGEPDFIYQYELTGDLFNGMREAIKVMCIDTHDELKDAWGTLIEHSDENGVMPPRALRYFNDVIRFVSYNKTKELNEILKKKDTKKDTLILLDKLNRRAAIIRRSYKDSKKLANQKL